MLSSETLNVRFVHTRTWKAPECRQPTGKFRCCCRYRCGPTVPSAETRGAWRSGFSTLNNRQPPENRSGGSNASAHKLPRCDWTLPRRRSECAEGVPPIESTRHEEGFSRGCAGGLCLCVVFHPFGRGPLGFGSSGTAARGLRVPYPGLRTLPQHYRRRRPARARPEQRGTASNAARDPETNYERRSWYAALRKSAARQRSGRSGYIPVFLP